MPSEKTKRKKNKHLKVFIVHKSTHKLDNPYSMTDLLFFPEIFLLKDMLEERFPDISVDYVTLVWMTIFSHNMKK